MPKYLFIESFSASGVYYPAGTVHDLAEEIVAVIPEGIAEKQSEQPPQEEESQGDESQSDESQSEESQAIKIQNATSKTAKAK